MAEREPGPYWVRDRFDDDWVVALWNGSAWQLHGDTTGYRDGAFLEIGLRAEMPPLVIERTPPEVVHYDTNTPEGKRALAGFLKVLNLPEWPEPQPITDAQKTGERFLVWFPGGRAVIVFPQGETIVGAPSYGPIHWSAGWYHASWGSDSTERVIGFKLGSWNIGGDNSDGMIVLLDEATDYLSLPPDVKPD